MEPPVIINDSAKKDVAGDLCIYDSEESALRALDIESADDPYLNVIDRKGDCFRIVFDPKNQKLIFKKIPNLKFLKSELHDLLCQHIKNAHIKNVNQDQLQLSSVDELIEIVFRFDPNPYSGPS